jgi:hypothetical protein
MDCGAVETLPHYEREHHREAAHSSCQGQQEYGQLVLKMIQTCNAASLASTFKIRFFRKTIAIDFRPVCLAMGMHILHGELRPCIASQSICMNYRLQRRRGRSGWMDLSSVDKVEYIRGQVSGATSVGAWGQKSCCSCDYHWVCLGGISQSILPPVVD